MPPVCIWRAVSGFCWPQVWLWNLDSGAVLRKLVAPGLAARPQTERAVEALAFMHGDFRCGGVTLNSSCCRWGIGLRLKLVEHQLLAT